MKKTFASKLHGRLTMLNETGRVCRTSQEASLSKRHGERLARLVGAGNTYAIDLVELCEARDAYCRREMDVDVLREYDEVIGTLKRRLGIAEGVGVELTEMLKLAGGAGFHGPRHLKSQLMEGLILNVNTLASRALAIPSGEYVVWTTDAGHTMLVPTSESRATNEIVPAGEQSYEIHTDELLGCWNKLERVIGERHERPKHKTSTSGEGGEGREPRVSKSGTGHPNLRSARLGSGKSLSDVSSATGWAIPTIAKAELYSKDDPRNPHSPSYEVIDDLVTYYGADYKAAFGIGQVEPYKNTVQNTNPSDANKLSGKSKKKQGGESKRSNKE